LTVSRLTPEQRSLRAKIASHESWARTADPSDRTAPARRAFADKFQREVDPDGVLSPDDRARRAEHARKAYYARLALASVRARRRRAQPDEALTEGGPDAA